MNILFFLTPKTDVVSLMDTDSVYTVLETLKKYRYASVPILNEAGNYVGTVKEGDLLWYIDSMKKYDLESLKEINIMEVPRRSNNDTAKIDANVEDLLGVLINQNFVPVIDDAGIFIGIVKRREVISYTYDLLKGKDQSLDNMFNKN